MARKQRPKRAKKTPAGVAKRKAARQEARQDQRQAARKQSRIAQRIADRIANGQTAAGSSASYIVPPGTVDTGTAYTPGYPVPAGTAEYPAPLPGTTGTTNAQTAGQPSTYDWAPEGERHAVTTNQLPPDSWPPVDLPSAYPGNFGATDMPIDNGQANPQTTYGGAADIETSPYYDYDETAY
jgi:hypothetical protein